MRNVLIKMGYDSSMTDSCIYFRVDKKGTTLIAFHVDDVLVSSNSAVHMNELKQAFKSEYGELQWAERKFSYLGMYLSRNDDYSVTVDMTSYAIELTTKYDKFISERSRQKDPSTVDLFKYELKDGEKSNDEEIKLFKSITMALMYLTTVRIDILKECIILAMHSSSPTNESWNLLGNVLRYVKKLPSLAINFGSDDLSLNVYADAGYGEHNDGRSHSGIYITLGANGGPIIVKSKKQNLVTQSSTEAEMVALTEAVNKALPLGKLLVEMKLMDSIKLIVHQDNLSTIHLARVGEGIGGKAKHFRVRYHFLRELIEEKVICIVHCNTTNMIADLFTKPMIGKERFRQVVRAMFQGDYGKFVAASDEALARVTEKTEKK